MKTRISIALFAVLLTGGAAAEAKTVDRPNIIFVLYDDLDATRGGNLAGVQAELDKGVDVSAKGERDMTPLHEAWRKEIVELLIAKGADVNAKGNDYIERERKSNIDTNERRRLLRTKQSNEMNRLRQRQQQQIHQLIQKHRDQRAEFERRISDEAH